MPGTSFRCKLVTPAAALIDDKVTYAQVPAHDGLMGVAYGHAPMLVKLGMGELRLDMADDAKLGKGGSRSFLLDGGFMKIADNELTILAEGAYAAEGLSASEAEAEVSKLASAKPKDASREAAEALQRQRELARRKLAMARGAKAI